MTAGSFTERRRRHRAAAVPRVGLFGLLGSGNIGNDGSLESLLSYLRNDQPEAVIDSMCTGPEQLLARYGIPAIPLQWYQKYEGHVSGVTLSLLKTMSKVIDVFRVAVWARRHDVVIVPGAGALEATLPMRPWGLPYSLFLLCVSGKLFGTKVALISVGASAINQRSTEWLFNGAARLASYRSYRDTLSRDAMQTRGLDTTGDEVYPDLVFGLPNPPAGAGDPMAVGLGVMAYYGGNDDRRNAAEINRSYITKMKQFARFLIDTGHSIRLVGGDSKFDYAVVDEIIADLRSYQPDLEPGRVTGEPVSSLEELMEEMAGLGTVVAIRYHNVMCALKLAKPTLSISYAAKHDVLMADMGLSEFCLPAISLDVAELTQRFTELESRATALRETIVERNTAKQERLNQQFTALSVLLFPAAGGPVPPGTGCGTRESAGAGRLPGRPGWLPRISSALRGILGAATIHSRGGPRRPGQ